MNRKFKVGDWVIYTDKEESNSWKEINVVSLYNKIGKIIKINPYTHYFLIKFKEWINGYHGSILANDSEYCKWCNKEEFELAINHLKFKKWVKG